MFIIKRMAFLHLTTEVNPNLKLKINMLTDGQQEALKP